MITTGEHGQVAKLNQGWQKSTGVAFSRNATPDFLSSISRELEVEASAELYDARPKG